MTNQSPATLEVQFGHSFSSNPGVCLGHAEPLNVTESLNGPQGINHLRTLRLTRIQTCITRDHPPGIHNTITTTLVIAYDDWFASGFDEK